MKTPLTTQQRNAIYKEALKRTWGGSVYMCNNIYFAMVDLYGKEYAQAYDYENVGMVAFPEILKHKPSHIIENGEVWFDAYSIAPRIAILQQAIAETEPEYEVKYVVEAPKEQEN